MTTRELQPAEWSRFFDGFSRQFRGRRTTVQVIDSPDAQCHTLALRLPLLGITAEPPRGRAESIHVMVGESPVGNVVHFIRQPSRVRVAQLSNGEDDLLIIDSAAGPTTRIDFRVVAAPDPAPSAVDRATKAPPHDPRA